LKSILVLLSATAVCFGFGLRVAGRVSLVSGPMPAPGQPQPTLADGRVMGEFEDTTVIAYDNGVHQTWWCSDRDSFGAAVKFTPAEYPCEVVGARAEVGCDTTTGGRQVYLRVFDDNGTGGLPGAVLYEQHRPDVPHGQNVGFRDYDLMTPVVIDSGDFYLCFWQKHWFNMLFGTDTHFDSVPRQWWYFPDLKWVTPMGMDAADHLIRARVLYPSGIEAEGTGAAWIGLKISPNPVHARAAVNYVLPAVQGHLAVVDACGRVVSWWRLGTGRRGTVEFDTRSLACGTYFLRLSAGRLHAIRRLVVQR
jgi:hypothetical protein